jgi:hypothetical protein
LLRFRLLRLGLLSSAALLLLLLPLRLLFFFLGLGFLFLGLLLLCCLAFLFGLLGYLATTTAVASTAVAYTSNYRRHDNDKQKKAHDAETSQIVGITQPSAYALLGWCLRSCSIATSGTSSL